MCKIKCKMLKYKMCRVFLPPIGILHLNHQSSVFLETVVIGDNVGVMEDPQNFNLEQN